MKTGIGQSPFQSVSNGLIAADCVTEKSENDCNRCSDRHEIRFGGMCSIGDTHSGISIVDHLGDLYSGDQAARLWRGQWLA